MIGVVIAAGLLVLAQGQSGPVNIRDCKHSYAIVERSLEIASRASRQSDPALDAMVASNADFELWDGDAAWTSGEQRGAGAARAFFKQVNSTKYVIHKGTAPVCGVDTKTAVVEFLSADGPRSIFVTFLFDGPKLVRATGVTDFREEGRLSAEGTNG